MRSATDNTSNNQTFLFDFDLPTLAFGADFIGFGGGAHNLTATSDTGSFAEHVIATAASPNQVFWGVIDDTAFNTIMIDTGIGADRISIDFVQHAPIPEPTAAILFFAGLLAVQRSVRPVGGRQRILG